jgi:FkbM family methyltransferase
MDPIDDFIQAHMPRKGVAFDIGANQGLYTKSMLRRARLVYAFEPHPSLATLLRRKFNRRRVQVVEKAVSDTLGEADFFLDRRPEWGGAASSLHALQGLEGQREKVQVATTTIDRFCADHAIVPNFIKIDTEGNEAPTIVGGQKTILTCKPFLIFEFWESWWDRGLRHVFDVLRPHYHLLSLQTGADADAYYSKHGNEKAGSTTTVDIGCIPRG